MTAPGPEGILKALISHGVDFVVVGGVAVVAHGSRRMTRDIDVFVEPGDENLSRLQGALAALKAVQLLPDGGEGPLGPADLAMVGLGTTLHTQTAAGRLDVVGAPPARLLSPHCAAEPSAPGWPACRS